MADLITTNLALTEPEVGASTDTWGTKINADLSIIDALFNSTPALLVTKGGTGASTASGARTGLGLGTVSTQDASAIAITGGAVNGTPIGASTPSTGKFTTVQLTSTGITFSDSTVQSSAASSFTSTVQSISTNTTLAASQQNLLVKVDATSGNVTATLFTAIGNAGKVVTVKRSDATTNTITVATTSSQTIDGQSTLTIFSQNDAYTFISDNVNWAVI